MPIEKANREVLKMAKERYEALREML